MLLTSKDGKAGLIGSYKMLPAAQCAREEAMQLKVACSRPNSLFKTFQQGVHMLTLTQPGRLVRERVVIF